MVEGRVKGTIVMQTVKFIRSKKEEGRRLVPENLQHYLSGRILPTSWYPEEDFLVLMQVTTELFAGPGSGKRLDAWEKASRVTAPFYFDETYSVLVRKGDPAKSLAQYGILWRLRRDTGVVEHEQLGDHEALLRMKDFALVSAQMCASIQGDLMGLLDSAGAKDVAASHPRCRSKGDPLCEWHLPWR
jgi:hypothetical protein